MFKGKSINAAVETIYDAFYEALADGQDITLLQTDFCKAYDYVNHDALIHIWRDWRLLLKPFLWLRKYSIPLKPGYPQLEGNLAPLQLTLLPVELEFDKAAQSPLFSS